MPYGVQIKMHVDGRAVLDRLLPSLSGRVNNLTRFWEEEAVPLLREQQEQVFAAEGASDDLSKWQNLNKKYAEWKAKRFPGKGILERTGALRQSFRGGSGAVAEASATRLRFGTEVASNKGFPYPLAHQKGTAKMPRRPPLRLSAKTKREIVERLARSLRVEP